MGTFVNSNKKLILNTNNKAFNQVYNFGKSFKPAGQVHLRTFNAPITNGGDFTILAFLPGGGIIFSLVDVLGRSVSLRINENPVVGNAVEFWYNPNTFITGTGAYPANTGFVGRNFVGHRRSGNNFTTKFNNESRSSSYSFYSDPFSYISFAKANRFGTEFYSNGHSYVLVYDRALSDTEIGYIYNNLNGREPGLISGGLVGYYKMDAAELINGSFVGVRDFSSAGNHLYFAGAAAPSGTFVDQLNYANNNLFV